MPELPRLLVSEPHDLLEACAMEACRAAGVEPSVGACWIESSDYLHDEAAILDQSELADAEAALIEDGIFADRQQLENVLGDQHGVNTDREASLRAAIKYGWALAHLKITMGSASASARLVWSVSAGGSATSPGELRFLLGELQHPGISHVDLDLCWPVALEPARDLEEERVPTFLQAAQSYAPILYQGGAGIVLRHAADKTSLLGAFAQQFGGKAVLDFNSVGLMESARIIARMEPALFRRWLNSAQEHFTFDKGRQELSTTEDDIHALPEVADDELERLFVDDFRGRQLLHITGRSCLGDASLGGELEEAYSNHRAALVGGITGCVAERLRLCREWTPG